MKERIFRKKSLKDLDKQERLDAYLKVAHPTVWISLGIISVLLIGLISWGLLGRIEIKVSGAGEVENNILINFIKKDYFNKVEVGKTIHFKNQSCKIALIFEPIKVDETFNQYLRKIGGFTIDEYVYPCLAEVNIEDGYYVTHTVTDVVAPFSYVFK